MALNSVFFHRLDLQQPKRLLPTIRILIFGLISLVFAHPLEAQTALETPEATPIVIKDALVKIAELVEVPAEQTGVLAELLVREGAIVKKNELIGRLKDAELQIQRNRMKLQSDIATAKSESQVDIEYAKKSYQVAAAEVQRSEQANQRVQNSIPLTRIEKQRLEKERTRLQLEQAERDFRIGSLQAKLAEEDLRLAELHLQQSEIRCPIDGLVVAIETSAGEWVQPGQTLAKIAAIDQLKLEGFVDAKVAGQLSISAPVNVKFKQTWLPQSLPGKIIFINPEANPVNLNVTVWVEIENEAEKLMPGMRGDVEIGN